MPDAQIGSIWTIAGMDQPAVVLLGPFGESRGNPEYVIAPLYLGAEPGFRQTDEDVRLEAQETGIGVRFAALWNAGPVLAGDLGQQLGLLPDDATALVRDVYWATLNEEALPKGLRVGKPIRSSDEPVADFQEDELERWTIIAGRVLAAAEPPPAAPPVAQFRCANFWSNDIQIIVDQSDMRMLLEADPSTIAEVPVVSPYRRTVAMWWAGSYQMTVPPIAGAEFAGLQVQIPVDWPAGSINVVATQVLSVQLPLWPQLTRAQRLTIADNADYAWAA